MHEKHNDNKSSLTHQHTFCLSRDDRFWCSVAGRWIEIKRQQQVLENADFSVLLLVQFAETLHVMI
jgi:hypothetical protein